MFKNIHFNQKNKKIYLTEVYNGKVVTSVEDFEYTFYINDPKKKSPIKNIHNQPVLKQHTRDKKQLKMLKDTGLTLYESDVNEEMQFLQHRYRDVELKPDVNDFNVAMVDIEVESEFVFPKPEEAKFPINLISVYSTKTKKMVTWGIRDYTGDSDLVEEYRYFADEKVMLINFINWFRKQKFDILTGWYCLHKNSNIWLSNKILPINECKNDSLHKYGDIVAYKNTGEKIGYEIELENGTKIITSETHIFPIHIKEKNKYVNKNTIINENDVQVKKIIKLQDKHDCYFRIDDHINVNKDLTIRDLILENIEDLLKNDNFNFLLSKKMYKIYKPNIKYNSYSYTLRNPFKFSYKELLKLTDISIDNIKQMFKDEDCVSFLFESKQKTNINISKNISNNILKILGLIYTDGTKEQDHFSFYNYDIQLMKYFRKITAEESLIIPNKKDFDYRTRIHYKKNILGLLNILIYKNNKKEIDLKNLSLLSYNQFKSFFSGIIDGDGWVTQHIGYGNIRTTDCKKINELLKWNNVTTTICLNDTRISIPNISNNKHFYINLDLKNKKRQNKLKDVNFFDYKNTPSKNIKKYIYDDYSLVRIKSITQLEKKEMWDIETTSHYFNTNGGIKSHNCKDFDVQYILNRKENLEIAENLTAFEYYHDLRTTIVKNPMTSGVTKIKSYYCKIPNLIILDSLELFKKFTFKTLQAYNLQFVSNFLKVGGKLELEGQVNNEWKHNWNRFVEYNIQDVILVKKIEEKKKHIELAIQYASQALIPIDKVFSSIATVEGYIARDLHKRNMVATDKKIATYDRWREEKLYIDPVDGHIQNLKEGDKMFEPFFIKGAYVSAKAGLFKNLMDFDITSLYPFNMIQYNTSPEVKVFNPSPERIAVGDLIKTEVNGVYYLKNQRGIIPEVVEKIFNERKEFKKLKFKYINEGNEELGAYYHAQQHIRKILINSFYGCIINKHSRFYDVDNGRVITRGGRELIKYLSKTTNDYFKQVWHKVAPVHFPNLKEYPKIKNDLVVVIDTDSVIGSSKIITDDGEKTIEQLFDLADNIVQHDKGNFVGNFNTNIKSLSFNINTQKTEMKNIKYVMKHKVKKGMYKLKVGNNEVIMTDDHSVIINRKGKFIDISPKEIRKGDVVININRY